MVSFLVTAIRYIETRFKWAEDDSLELLLLYICEYL